MVGCDYHSAYRKFLNDLGINMQFCLAHLIRHVKFLTTLRDRATRGYGERLLETIKRLFHVWHQRDGMRSDRWKDSADRARREVLKVARRPPQVLSEEAIHELVRDTGKQVEEESPDLALARPKGPCGGWVHDHHALSSLA